MQRLPYPATSVRLYHAVRTGLDRAKLKYNTCSFYKVIEQNGPRTFYFKSHFEEPPEPRASTAKTNGPLALGENKMKDNGPGPIPTCQSSRLSGPVKSRHLETNGDTRVLGHSQKNSTVPVTRPGARRKLKRGIPDGLLTGRDRRARQAGAIRNEGTEKNKIAVLLCHFDARSSAEGARSRGSTTQNEFAKEAALTADIYLVVSLLASPGALILARSSPPADRD
ncbi:hypothetical protein RRG08_043072 [Elysia crispata]|uniref:Uncharacterized protein n=1 Tax=Elysia crispata TaxID=231223 RepID=A0AAE0XY41_9GAST|nr:hypothetical protein RRG08_043072 [Elysia crispata]